MSSYFMMFGGKRMDPIKQLKSEAELELHIEELEDRVAPDGGETVLPLPLVGKHHHHH
jgi:hypothetical protein